MAAVPMISAIKASNVVIGPLKKNKKNQNAVYFSLGAENCKFQLNEFLSPSPCPFGIDVYVEENDPKAEEKRAANRQAIQMTLTTDEQIAFFRELDERVLADSIEKRAAYFKLNCTEEQARGQYTPILKQGEDGKYFIRPKVNMEGDYAVECFKYYPDPLAGDQKDLEPDQIQYAFQRVSPSLLLMKKDCRVGAELHIRGLWFFKGFGIMVQCSRLWFFEEQKSTASPIQMGNLPRARNDSLSASQTVSAPVVKRQRSENTESEEDDESAETPFIFKKQAVEE
jgi:hypothetical protein